MNRLSQWAARPTVAVTIGSLPLLAAALGLLWTDTLGTGALEWPAKLGISLGLLALSAGLAVRLGRVVDRPIQTLANMVLAFRQGDYAVRPRLPRGAGAVSLAFREVRSLGDDLQAKSQRTAETARFLQKVLDKVDTAIFAFDQDDRLSLANRRGAQLLGQSAANLVGKEASQLGLASCLSGPHTGPVSIELPGGAGRWQVRRALIRSGGERGHLLTLVDLSGELRAEERLAWQRLLRVVSHELNNSLAPVGSLADSLSKTVQQSSHPDGWEEDMVDGLAVIASRAGALQRFIGACSRLAKLPDPVLERAELGGIIAGAARLEHRVPVQVSEGPAVPMAADASQLSLALTNLLKNAADAVLEAAKVTGTSAGPEVTIKWKIRSGAAVIRILDNGPGLPDTTNLFVPFFTTKENGEGIGLILSRQIAEAHGGFLTLENRKDGPGCAATLFLPINTPE